MIVNEHNVNDPKIIEELRAMGFVRLKPGQVVAEYKSKPCDGDPCTICTNTGHTLELVEVKP